MQSGGHPDYRPAANKPLGYAFVDLRLTRSEGTLNEMNFASEVEQGVSVGVPDEELEAYIVRKLGNLALTEHGTVKSSASKLLWIYRADQSPQGVREAADDALNGTSCRCTKKADGNVECQ